MSVSILQRTAKLLIQLKKPCGLVASIKQRAAFCSTTLGKAALLALVLALSLPPSLAKAEDARRWLIQDISRPPFEFKVYVRTGYSFYKPANILRYLEEHFPEGNEEVTPLPDEVLQKDAYGTYSDRFMDYEIWHNGKQIAQDDNMLPPGLILGRPPQADDFPLPGCTTYTLLFEHDATSSVNFTRQLYTACPDEDSLSEDMTICYYDLLYGGLEAQHVGEARILPSCDDSLDYFGSMGHWGLPRPTRLKIFDPKLKIWRADRPGEVPAHYVAQAYFGLRNVLEYSLKTYMQGHPDFAQAVRDGEMVRTADLTDAEDMTPAGRAEAVRQGTLIMAEMLARKSAVAKDPEDSYSDLDIAYATYSLYMLGLPERVVHDFFMVMAEESIRVNGGLYWSTDPEQREPDALFAVIKNACLNFDGKVSKEVLPR